MIITKIISNNAVMCKDDNDIELIAIGSGLGFGVKVDSVIDESKVEKLYKLSSDSTNKFERLVNNIPYQHITIANTIIEYAKANLDRDLNENIYITLTDHINFAIERNKQGIEFDNALLWEIKNYYKKEYEIGIKGLELIEENLGVKLPDSEAGFIAIHIVNACTYNKLTDTVKAPKVIGDIVGIIEECYGVEVNKGTISYDRFLTHLKYLVQRVVSKIGYDSNDSDFHKIFLENHPNSAKCAGNIAHYINDNFSYELSDEEQMYLSLHIERIISRDK